ncbi:hypothetical protein GOP80_04530 [Planococcaceae bacterium Storch 2/2-2]|nr:hypothetical protein [Planococcaceae bacterium Storch 2/2-2]
MKLAIVLIVFVAFIVGSTIFVRRAVGLTSEQMRERSDHPKYRMIENIGRLVTLALQLGTFYVVLILDHIEWVGLIFFATSLIEFILASLDYTYDREWGRWKVYVYNGLLLVGIGLLFMNERFMTWMLQA